MKVWMPRKYIKMTTAVVVLAISIVIITVATKQFPQKAISLIPEDMSIISCSVTGNTIDGAEVSLLTDTQQKNLLSALEKNLVVPRGFPNDMIGPYDKYVYTVLLEYMSAESTETLHFECKIDDRGKIYTQYRSYSIIGDFSDTLSFLNSLF